MHISEYHLALFEIELSNVARKNETDIAQYECIRATSESIYEGKKNNRDLDIYTYICVYNQRQAYQLYVLVLLAQLHSFHIQ